MIKIQFASKKEHAQTFAQITPSGKDPAVSEMCILGHFPFEKQQMGCMCQNGSKVATLQT